MRRTNPSLIIRTLYLCLSSDERQRGLITTHVRTELDPFASLLAISLFPSVCFAVYVPQLINTGGIRLIARRLIRVTLYIKATLGYTCWRLHSNAHHCKPSPLRYQNPPGHPNSVYTI